MRETRRNKIWALAGAFALALTVGAASHQAFSRRAAGASAAGEGLRDAVASPLTPATLGLAGKPVPTSWFKTPEQRRDEMDSALLASRRRRASSRRVSSQ